MLELTFNPGKDFSLYDISILESDMNKNFHYVSYILSYYDIKLVPVLQNKVVSTKINHY